MFTVLRDVCAPEVVRDRLAVTREVVAVTGARQVAKTTLARWLLPRAHYVTLDHPADADRARLSPDQFLRTLPQPAILDEIQYAPELLRHLKLAVDRDRRPGRFLATGSQTLSLMAGLTESLAGRAAVFTLPPLSLEEVSPRASLGDVDAFFWRSGYPGLRGHRVQNRRAGGGRDAQEPASTRWRVRPPRRGRRTGGLSNRPRLPARRPAGGASRTLGRATRAALGPCGAHVLNAGRRSGSIGWRGGFLRRHGYR